MIWADGGFLSQTWSYFSHLRVRPVLFLEMGKVRMVTPLTQPPTDLNLYSACGHFSAADQLPTTTIILDRAVLLLARSNPGGLSDLAHLFIMLPLWR